MLRNEYKEAKTKYELYTLTTCISNVLYYQYVFFTCFPLVFPYLINKISNKRGVQIRFWGLEKIKN